MLPSIWYFTHIVKYSNLLQKHMYNLQCQKNIKGKGEKEKYVISFMCVLLKNAHSILLNMPNEGRDMFWET